MKFLKEHKHGILLSWQWVWFAIAIITGIICYNCGVSKIISVCIAVIIMSIGHGSYPVLAIKLNKE